VIVRRGIGASGQAVAGQSLLASGQGFLVGGPIGAVVAGVASLIHSWISRVGPKQKVASTIVVNQAEPLLQQNLAAWNASSKSCAEQAVCLAAFDQVWNAVVQSCADPSLGDPGHSCIDDRMPVGMNFSYNTFDLVGNGMWDWFAFYRDPIANDPAAQGCCSAPPCPYPGCVLPASSCVPAGAVGGMNLPTLVLVGLLAGVAWWVMS
jgi:hypothetical protein